MKVPSLLRTALALACTLHCTAAEQNDVAVDVAIVGGGLSGLATAKDIAAAGKSFVVLEARDRVGGRVENQQLANGGVTELGAAFVGPTQDRVLALAEELNLQPFPEYNVGNNVLWRSGNISFYSAANGAVPPLDTYALLELGAVLANVDEMAKTINTSAPWSHPNASLWDSLTFATWLANITTIPDAAAFVETATTAIWSGQTSELSLLYVLSYIAASGNETMVGTLDRLIAVEDGAQESRIVGGTGLLATNLAEKLGSSNIKLSSPVRSITQTSSGYKVSSENYSVDAKHVVVAMSPPLAARIIYDPPLPAMRDQLTQRMFMGALGKAIAIYDTPFWRQYNLTGQAVSDSGTTRATFDVSPEDGSYGAMLGFIEADEMRALDAMPESAIQDLIMQDFVNYFGPAAAYAKEWVFKRWDNELYSRGAPTALAGPGTLSKYGPALRTPFGNIHFAGTEAAEYWSGYMDGAIRSGERAAKEVLDALD